MEGSVQLLNLHVMSCSRSIGKWLSLASLQKAFLSDSSQMLRDLSQHQKSSFAKDILRREQRLFLDIHVWSIFCGIMFNEALMIREKKLQSICGKSLKNYGFSVPQLNIVAINTMTMT